MSVWYRTGTISVSNGSTSVTGSGTTWVGVVRKGDALVAPDGLSYEITSVNSNTSLTLGSAYQGSNASGSEYAVQPTRGIAREWYDAVTAFQAQVSGWADGPLSGLFGNGSAGSPGVSFANQTNMGLYRASSSALAVSVGGSERARFTTSGMQVGGSEVFRRANAVGTVSQSGGVPTGAVIERGSNSNGEFVRFADGTQICSRTFSLPAPDSEFLTPSFPASFSAAPAVVLHACIPDQSSGDRYANVAYAAVSSSEISGIRVRRVTPNSDAAIVTYHAIGRWF